MRSRKIADVASPSSRSSGKLADRIRREIQRGAVVAGELLPSERVLAEEHGLSCRTVRRALKLLESEALIAAEKRRGYRVLGRANDPDKGCPFAFVFSSGGSAEWLMCRILAELQRAASRQRWSLLGVSLDEQSVGEVIDHLRSTRASGVVIDSGNAELLEQIQRLGIPAVRIETQHPGIPMDAVVQDGISGGALAGEYIASRGHKRIAYIGNSLRNSIVATERLSGAFGGLAREGAWLTKELCVTVEGQDLDAAARKVRSMLSSRRPPTGVIALWQGMGMTVVRVAEELGLKVGRDLDVVSWSTEEDYADRFVPTFPKGMVPPAAVWRVADLAEMAVSRLMQRRANPGMPVVTTRIPMTLKLP